jgi:geranylgeranyl diphosphate synthase, type I
MDLKTFKQTFDAQLDTYLSKKINRAIDIVQNPRLASVLQHIHTITFAWGKRIRPYCFFMWYHIYQKQSNDDVIQFGILFELLHTMALIHDDIIDEAEKRHNVATIHHFLHEQQITRRISEWQAILAWDILLARVYEILMQQYTIDTAQHQSAQQTVHTMIQEVILGEMIDVDLAVGEKASRETIERKNLYKTARYTFARPLIAGAQRAWASKEQIHILQQIGELLGLAYQTRDDLIDILETETDKTTFYDIQEWQQTILTNYIQNHENTTYRDLLETCMGNQLTQEQIQELKIMFHESWAIDFARQKIAVYIQDATALLEHIDFQNDQTYGYIQQLMNKLTMI